MAISCRETSLMEKYTARQTAFLHHLEKVTEALRRPEDMETPVQFRIIPVDEPGKHYSSRDDWMESILFRRHDFTTKILNSHEVVQLLTAPHDRFPLWIKTRLGDDGLIELWISKRFRPYRELLHQDAGYPPFAPPDWEVAG
jgi:hypothetical protein